MDWLTDGNKATSALLASEHDAVILDLALPNRSGLDLLQEFRTNGGTTPVLILTAFDAVQDKVAGLDAGADDYLVKPFDLEEVGARLRALHRRSHKYLGATLQHRRLLFDPATLTATMAGEACLTRCARPTGQPAAVTKLRSVCQEPGERL